MTYEVRSTPQAELQILEADLWGLENRDKAPDLFEEELTVAVARLRSAPLMIGRQIRNPFIGGVRRILMPRTRTHLYYIVDEVLRVVTIISVWGAMKGEGPDFRALSLD